MKAKALYAATCSIAVLATACKSRTLNSEMKYRDDESVSCQEMANHSEGLTYLVSPGGFVYTWLDARGIQTPLDAESFMRPYFRKIAPGNPNRKLNMGEGVYTAGNTFVSSDFGETLFALPVVKDCKFGFTYDDVIKDNGTSIRFVNSLVAGIAYPWRNTYALNLRNGQSIDYSKIKVVQTKKFSDIRLWNIGISQQPFETWLDAAAHYGVYFGALIQNEKYRPLLTKAGRVLVIENAPTLGGMEVFLQIEHAARGEDFSMANTLRDYSKLIELDFLPRDLTGTFSKAELMGRTIEHCRADKERLQRMVSFLDALQLYSQNSLETDFLKWKRE